MHIARSAKYRERSNQARQGTQVEKQVAKALLVVGSNEPDTDSLIQKLEKLKQKGLILYFFKPESAS